MSISHHPYQLAGSEFCGTLEEFQEDSRVVSQLLHDNGLGGQNRVGLFTAVNESLVFISHDQNFLYLLIMSGNSFNNLVPIGNV